MGKTRAADRRAVRWSISIAGAALLLGMAWIHEHLYTVGYATVPTIGPLFRLDAVLGVVGALALLVAALATELVRRTVWWRLTCAAGALLQLGTLGALVQSLTIGAFGFHETLDAPMIGRTVVVEVLGFLVLALGAIGPPRITSGKQSDRGEGERVPDGRRRSPHG
jgi:hypothetical protein